MANDGENGGFPEREAPTRPSGPEILRDLFQYLSEAREMNRRLTELANGLERELEERQADRKQLQDLEVRVARLEKNAERTA